MLRDQRPNPAVHAFMEKKNTSYEKSAALSCTAKSGVDDCLTSGSSYAKDVRGTVLMCMPPSSPAVLHARSTRSRAA